MKVVKPLNQGLIFKTFEANRSFYLCLAILTHFNFDSTANLVPEPELWKFAAEELGKDAMLDMSMPKPVGEVLVAGKCFTYREGDCAGEVRLTIGPVDKRLYVLGDRFWKRTAKGTLTITDPQPFSEMKISYEHAFGGPGFDKNPVGKGASAVIEESGATIRPLPNIESPNKLIGSPDDFPDPTGFGPLDMTWPQRAEKAGTYDRKWLEELFPGLAEDIDYTYFNAAPSDQWIEGYFKGDESFELKGMHPEKKTVSGVLPGVHSRCFLNRKTDDGEQFEEIKTSLDTVWLFPHAEKGIVIWRGVAEIGTDDASDVLHALVAYERLDDEPRPLDHYRQSLLKRIDERKGYLYLLDEKDLIPPGAKSGLATLMESVQESAESAFSRNMKNRAAKEKKNAEEMKEEALSKARAMMEKYGVDPEKMMPPPPPPSAMPEVPDFDLNNFDPEKILAFMEQAKAMAEEHKEKALAEAGARREQAEKKIRELCDKYNIDFDDAMAKVQSQKPKRPVVIADDVLGEIKQSKQRVEEQVRDVCQMIGADFDTIAAQAKEQATGKSFPLIESLEKVRKLNPDDPELVARLIKAEEATKDAYRKSAHNAPKPPPLSPEETARLKEEFMAAVAAGENFAWKDLAGIDLRDMDIHGLNLKNAWLEGANLTGANLSGADLSGAVLAWADLSGARLYDATLRSTNLGSANLTEAELVECDLTEAVLAKADLTGADLSGSNLEKADMMEAIFLRTNMSKANIAGAVLIETDFSGVDFSGADLSGTTFIRPKMDGVNFTGAKGHGVILVEPSCRNACFKNADLKNARFVNAPDLAGADFSGAVLDEANLMEADLTGAKFVKACLNKANLMKANLKEADLTGVVAKQANFMKADLEGAKLVGANLMEALLKNARLKGADLRLANLYGAEVMRAVFGNTKLDGANLKMTKIEIWGTHDQG